MSYAYLGPAGTFTEMALQQVSPDGIPFATVLGALGAVRSGRCEGAVVPIENSVNGMVPTTLGELAASAGELTIVAEMEVPVRLALLGTAGARLAGISRVHSHPHALDQCRGWLAGHAPGAELCAAGSTAGAAETVALSGDPRQAAIAAPIAAAARGLAVLADDIGDDAAAVTRFLAVRRRADAPASAPTAQDHSSFIVRDSTNRPGTLAGFLGEFAARSVSVCRIHSWPTRRRLGTYDFAVDVDGHIEEPAVAAAVAAIRRGGEIVFLGSYPRAAAPAVPATSPVTESVPA